MSESSQPDTTRKPIHRSTRSTAGVTGWGGIVFGLIFLAVGVFIILVSANVVTGGKKHAPDWVIGMVGGIFAFAGLAILLTSLRAMGRQQRYRQQAMLHPEEPWLADYAWDTQGAKGDTLKKSAGYLFMGLFITLFMAPFHWWAFLSDDGPWMVKMIVGLFDLAILGIFGAAVYQLLRWLKYGTSMVRFRDFPFFLGEELRVVVASTRPVSNINKRTFTLRCIEEKHEVTKQRGKTQHRTVAYQLYADTQTEEHGDNWSTLEMEREVVFQLPVGDYATTLSAKEPRYWELETHAETSGIDHGATFLVPVYSRPTSQGVVFGSDRHEERDDLS